MKRQLEFTRLTRLAGENREPETMEYDVGVSVYGVSVEVWINDNHSSFRLFTSDELMINSLTSDDDYYQLRLLQLAGDEVGVKLRWTDSTWHFNRYAMVWERTASPLKG